MFVIAWWWLIPAVMVGAVIGIFLMGICAANSITDRRRKWWEE